MVYPQAPWTIQGYGLQSLHLLDIARVRPLIPSELEIVSIFPGKTIGGLYVASYGEGSALFYNELIVVSGFVTYAGAIGAWISHIYVDHPDSVAGGREIWGLPKELAQFTWQTGANPSVQVSQGDTLLCRLTCSWQLPGWQLPITGSVFSTLGSKLLRFEAKGTLKAHLAGLDLYVPPESQFAELKFGQSWLNAYCNPLQITVDAPAIVSDKSTSV